jgi:competence/damage-inducible protein CinA-like protein
MRAEILTVGSELLLGQIVDTNAAFIARHLAGIGLDLFHKVTVGDNQGRVAEAIRTALGRAQVVITTGGLGPTADDVTREAVAEAFGRDLVFVPELMEQVDAFFRARGLPSSPSNRKQAYIPAGAIPVENPLGTAPCFIVEEGDRSLAVLPGVPREMEYLLVTRVLPHVRERHGIQGTIVSRLVRVCGLGESRVGELLADFMTRGGNPTVGTMAHLGRVDVRIAAKGPDDASARTLIAPVEAAVRQRLGDVVYGTDGDTLEGVVAAGLEARALTLALVEAGTGGLVTERLTAGGAAARVRALVASPADAARTLGVEDGDSLAPRLAGAARAWAGAALGAAVVVGPPEGEGLSRAHDVAIAVRAQGPAGEWRHRLAGDAVQVRARAQVLALDGLRRALGALGR